MVHTVQPIDITERLRSLSAEPVPDRNGGASANKRAERDVVLTASAGGRVAGIMTGEGVDVTAGTVLLQLDDRLAREELRRTDLTLKAKRLDRQQAELALSRQHHLNQP